MSGYKVYDCDGNDITDKRQWLLGPDMTLYYMSVLGVLVEEEDCWVSPD